jgi:hypothetical protein
VYAKTITEPLRPPPSYLIGILLAVVVCRHVYVQWAINHALSLQSFVLTSEPIYRDALDDWLSGGDPYRTIHGPLRFVYPPIFLYVGGFLARVFPDHIGWYLYAFVHVASTIALPIVLARFYFRQTWLNAGFALLIFFAEPRLTGVLALTNGNIASALYLLAFLAMLPGVHANRWTLFYLAVFIGALVKLPLVLLLLLPLLTGKGQWRYCSICAVAIAAAYTLQRVFFSDLYAGYQWSLVQQIRVIHHYGYGVLGIAAGLEYKLYGKVSILPTIISGVFAAILIVALFLLRRRIGPLASDPLWLSLVVLSVILVSPRILNYDADIALFAAFVIFVNVLHTRRLLTLLVLLFLPSLFVPYFVNAQTLVGCYETLLLILAFAGGFFTLWRESAAPGQPIPSEA